MDLEALSPLQRLRAAYHPPLPRVFEDLDHCVCEKGETLPLKAELAQTFSKTANQPLLKIRRAEKQSGKLKRVGVVLSGGQAPGGHNVIAGLLDALKILHPSAALFGFLGGPKGIIENRYKEIKLELIGSYRNQGGFDLIGSGRDKIIGEDNLEKARKNCEELKLDGLVIVGGDDSNTNAAYLAEYFAKKGSSTVVTGVPKTIDGDLKNEFIESSFGFDTACKVYSELVGNIERDCLSSKKYYHFIRLMGRAASHITLECALQTRPNFTFISEEVQAKGWTLENLISQLEEMVIARAEQGKNYGVVLIPEGVIEFIPEIKLLIAELNLHLETKRIVDSKMAMEVLSESACKTYRTLPRKIQNQLLLERDPHGNVQVSRIQTEQLFVDLLIDRLESNPDYQSTFSYQTHFMGYEARSALPSNFDCQYGYALGYCSALLVSSGANGYMASISNLTQVTAKWEAGGVPLLNMMNLEQRGAKKRAVIKKELVNLEGPAFAQLLKNRAAQGWEDHYLYPGPIQFFGPQEVCEEPLLTIQLEKAVSPV